MHTLSVRDPQVQGFDKPNQIMVRFLSENDNNDAAIGVVKDALTKTLPGVTFSHPDVVGSKVSGELYRNGIMAVSYTHLDVYKRQIRTNMKNLHT